MTLREKYDELLNLARNGHGWVDYHYFLGKFKRKDEYAPLRQLIYDVAVGDVKVVNVHFNHDDDSYTVNPSDGDYSLILVDKTLFDNKVIKELPHI
jgi:hypothetical protein